MATPDVELRNLSNATYSSHSLLTSSPRILTRAVTFAALGASSKILEPTTIFDTAFEKHTELRILDIAMGDDVMGESKIQLLKITAPAVAAGNKRGIGRKRFESLQSQLFVAIKLISNTCNLQITSDLAEFNLGWSALAKQSKSVHDILTNADQLCNLDFDAYTQTVADIVRITKQRQLLLHNIDIAIAQTEDLRALQASAEIQKSTQLLKQLHFVSSQVILQIMQVFNTSSFRNTVRK